MTQCWHTMADERPRFATIIERLGYCLQDPDIADAQLFPFQKNQPAFDRNNIANRSSLIENQTNGNKTANAYQSSEPLPTRGRATAIHSLI